MKSKALWTSGIAFLLLTVLLAIAAPAANAKAKHKHVRWDIISLSPSVIPPVSQTTISEGGSASAFANDVSKITNDASKITLTGTGTFVAPTSEGGSHDVTGGGTWETFDNTGASNGRGTFEVTKLVRFDVAPGTLVGLPFTDTIDDLEDDHSGLAVLKILYSDGDRGILVVSCDLAGAPASVFEGVTASKGFVDYWNREAPVSGTDKNRTAFHIAD
jgi:hypothetical protein